jgi:ssDNA-binding Zn-finger/Zn-ribbon topoisomerase 1
MTPPTCPYCHTPAKLTNSTEIYNKNYGWLWTCTNYPTCDTYVGCHQGTTVPLGTLANKELREWRSKAHRTFDQTWKHNQTTRTDAYAKLAKQLNIPIQQCHIAMFTKQQCQHIIQHYTKDTQ